MRKLTEEERNRLIAGIAEYKHEREVIKRVLRKHTRISTTEFDAIFGDSKFVTTKTGEKIEIRRRPKLRFMGARGETLLLGDVFAAGDWSKWLHLIQIMCVLGIVHLEEREMYYSLEGG